MKDTINLLPKKGLKDAQVKKKATKVFFLAGFGVLFLFLAWLIPFTILLGLNRQHNAQVLQINQKEESIKSLSKIESQYRNVYNKTNGAAIILQKKKIFLSLLEDIKKLINPPLLITSMSLGTDTIKLTVTTSDIGSTLAYLTTLEDEGNQQKIFKSLVVSSIGVSKVSGYEVKIEGAL